MEKHFFICKRCYSKFDKQNTKSFDYWIAFVGLVVLWKGITSVFPGYLALIVALSALYILVRAIRNMLAYSKNRNCPSCHSTEVIPESSSAGLELQNKVQLIQNNLSRKWKALGSAAGLLGLLFISIGFAYDDKFRREYNFHECMNEVNNFEKSLSAKSINLNDYGALFAIGQARKKAKEAKNRCVNILGIDDALPQILVEGNIKIANNLVYDADGIGTLFITIFEEPTPDSITIFGAAEITIDSDNPNLIHFSVRKNELDRRDPLTPIPTSFKLKARLDKDGLAGRDSTGDLTGYVEYVPLGSRNVEILIDTLIE